MTEENLEKNNVQTILNKLVENTKRDIFRINGDRTTAINLEHVVSMSVEGKQVNFSFYTNQINIEMVDEDAAKRCFEELLNIWSANKEDKKI
jgi:hypothetical protein